MRALETLTVLGGGSPFTAGLLEAIFDSELAAKPHRLVLFGRDIGALAAVAARARSCLSRLGWRVDATTELAESLRGATYVIHQIRYGGLKGRMEAEQLAHSFGIAADETLGPAALYTALRSVAALREVSEAIVVNCPEAWVLNLTNPLSVTTSLMFQAGLTRCIGICELPESTAGAVASRLGIQEADLQWDYVGLNHRGFLYNLRIDGASVLDTLVDALKSAPLPGGTWKQVAAMQAVPLKYFALLTKRSEPIGRAQKVVDVRDAVMRELMDDPERSPPSLKMRDMDWYAKSLVPILVALVAERSQVRIVNYPGPDGLVVEAKVKINRYGVVPVPRGALPAAVESWMERFMQHERALLAAAYEPSNAAIHEAVSRDPLIGTASVERITRSLCEASFLQ